MEEANVVVVIAVVVVVVLLLPIPLLLLLISLMFSSMLSYLIHATCINAGSVLYCFTLA